MEHIKIPTSQESLPQERREQMETAVEEIRAEAHEELRRKFDAENGETPMAYHLESHTDDVERYVTDRIALVRQFDPALVSEEEELLLKAEAAAHDIVQDFDRTPTGGRARKRGPNEEASAQWLIDRLKQNPAAFSIPEDEIRKDVEVTIPDADFKDGPDLWHGRLAPDAPLRRLILADADLRGAVSDQNPQKFIESGTAEWRELFMWIGEAAAGPVENIGQETRVKILESFLGWRGSQGKFAEHQARHFREVWEANEALNRSPRAAEIKRALFSVYFENIEQNGEAAREYYEDLLQRFGVVRQENEDDETYAASRKAALGQRAADNDAFRIALKEMGYDRPLG